MELLGIITAIIISLLFAVIFYYFFRVRGPWGAFWTFFLVLFLAVWAAELWITPVGPYFYDIAWVPLVFVGLLVAIGLAAATGMPERIGRKRLEEGAPAPEEAEAATLGIFFWLLLAVLITVVLIGLFR